MYIGIAGQVQSTCPSSFLFDGGRMTYPIPFSGSTDNYMLFVQGQYMPGKVVEIMVASKNTTSQGYAYSRYTDNSKPDTHNFDWYAIGRWK